MGTPDELKKTVGGDVVSITTKDNATSKIEIEKAFSLSVSEKAGELYMTCSRGDTCIPELIRIPGRKGPFCENSAADFKRCFFGPYRQNDKRRRDNFRGFSQGIYPGLQEKTVIKLFI